MGKFLVINLETGESKEFEKLDQAREYAKGLAAYEIKGEVLGEFMVIESKK